MTVQKAVRLPARSRPISWILVVLVMGLVACGGATTETEPRVLDPTTPGPHSEGGEVFIVYPDDPAPFMEPASVFESRWSTGTDGLGFPTFSDAEDGVRSSVRVDNALRVWVDLAVDDDAVRIAQLTIENRATDAEDPVYVEQLIPAFLAAAGIAPVPPELGLSDIDSLFEEARTVRLVRNGRTIQLAIDKWSLVLGVTDG